MPIVIKMLSTLGVRIVVAFPIMLKRYTINSMVHHFWRVAECYFPWFSICYVAHNAIHIREVELHSP